MDEDVKGARIFQELLVLTGSEVSHEDLKSISKEKTASTCSGTEGEELVVEDEDEETPNWRKLSSDGMEDKEKVLLDDYASVLRDYREVKRKLRSGEKSRRVLRACITAERTQECWTHLGKTLPYIKYMETISWNMIKNSVRV
ncbi:kinase interacting family protein [Raphanus sativus]|nr:kinase interacting family protein [Raphanus sativus]